ncbi:TRAP transporter large permease [Mesorhizobium sp. 1B3]|uniref:TRAP transporter large permease n=1 Tax=Mesorhizobium sp. 1B3 TaxID=3243599 RepID=UPI003D98D55B
MTPELIGFLSVGLIFGLILLGMHIGVALAAVSFIGVYMITGRMTVAASLLQSTAYSGIADYAFAVIPLFVVMGLFAMRAGVVRDLFDAAETLTRKLHGGIGVSTVFANAIFAAVTGVSVASAAVFSKIAIPEMNRLGYDRRFGLGIVAASALLGMLIPPSVLMIIYGVVAEQSIGRLFAAGIGPGLLVTVVLMLAIMLRVRANPQLAGGVQTAAKQRMSPTQLVVKMGPIGILILLVLGGIYGGLFTPTEAGAIGALGALVLAALKHRFAGTSLIDTLLDTGRACGAIFFLLITAQMYSRMLTLSRLPDSLTIWAIGLELPAIVVILAFVLVLLLLGCIIDSVSILLLAMPIMVPVVINLGYDPIWFGMVAILTIELGLITPPFGMVVFAMRASLAEAVPLEEIFRGVLPFFAILLIALAVVIAIPEISLFFPRLIYG